MALGESLNYHLDFWPALAASFLVALAGTFATTPRIIRKLLGAGVSGRDINKVDRPVVAEMGGIAVFLGFNVGVFAFMILHTLPASQERIILAALITAAGAAMTGVIDDLVELRQRFKAFIPLVFAAPLAAYVGDYSVALPILGRVEFWFVYPFVLVPLAIACAANGFNMLEGYNGLGAGLGVITGTALAIMSVLNGHPEALVLLVPVVGALLAFLWFNRYPARVFPGDTMTFLAGALLAAGGILGKVEFWGALLFLPHIAEFFLKARGNFDAENFAKRLEPSPGRPAILSYEGRTESLTHILLKRRGMTEPRIVWTFWMAQVVLATIVIAGFFLLRTA